ncbi:hypothetical protein FNL39_108151 [Nocardia caishijiensis]|uniref:Nitrate ABC transporter substrate-binding protein n=1 Tax=Nocardia caishijiensis TaxID=184756 RepID=A0ABQ6YI65_9NOCA|nr:hypothetical protein FNL39_108151 [Nocardia caishijiensis]
MYTDNGIHLGLVHGDQLIAAAPEQRVVGVTPLLQYNPAMPTVVVSKDQIFPQWLVAKGLLKSSQLDTSYDGAPARFVGDPAIAQQGFANSEPYTYEHETPHWNKPVAYAMVKDAGYDAYASNVTVRADALEDLAPCLSKVVPRIQRTGKNYVTGPDAVNATIVDWVDRDMPFTPYSEGEAAYSARLLADKEVIAPGPDGVYGSYDLTRIQPISDDIAALLEADGAPRLPRPLPLNELYTNRFVSTEVR